jgi:hypothetical protein
MFDQKAPEPSKMGTLPTLNPDFFDLGNLTLGFK